MKNVYSFQSLYKGQTGDPALSSLMVYVFIFFTMLMHLWGGGQVPHFFKTLITSSAAMAESGQRNSQLRKSIFKRQSLRQTEFMDI
jgi:hypothetical protein